MFDDADYCMCNTAVAEAFCSYILSSADGARADQCSIASTLGRQSQDFAHTRKICNKIQPTKNPENPAARRKANERQTKGSFRSWCAPLANLAQFGVPPGAQYSGAGSVFLCWGHSTPVLGLSCKKDFQGKRKVNERCFVENYLQENG